MLEVARSLIGHLVVRENGGVLMVGRIVETEAYAGLIDPASHAYRGPTDRCQAMFGPVGRAYVYFTYGNHHCLNVIGGHRQLACAVLLRAVEPLGDRAPWRERRVAATKPGTTRDRLTRGLADRELANGPGKLAAALTLDLSWNGHDLTEPRSLWIARGRRAREVLWTPRVGLGQTRAATWLWRCVDAGSSGVTRVPKSWPTAAEPRPGLEELKRTRALETAE